ncbi:MAG TPA: histidine kinase dimerization/phosphoacceptor domain -containing protein [Phenylobacterium sp.]|nr:histidine kinase dimerization/phosphoacceptor domain -containing protein [Phenylobacterium sp.]
MPDRTQAWQSESEERLRAFIENAPRKMWVSRPNGTVEFLNREWRDYTGLSVDEVLSWRDALHPDDHPVVDEALARAAARTEPYEAEVRIRRQSDGAYRWHLGRVAPVHLDGQLIAWIGAATDIQQQHELQERQRLMTQEVSHRVKNSLALVASQISLQARTTDNEEARKVLLDAYARVHTIAGVHDHLWRQYDARVIDMCGFLRDLCGKLEETSPVHEIVFNGERVVVPTDQAVPIGLLLNELVTNALKYAYPEGRGGLVEIDLRAPSDGFTILEVTDHGVGVPADFDLFAPTKSFGMRLIVNTLRQLQAAATVTRLDPGVKFQIRIPHDKNESRT